jgi:hypothetical protein
MTDQRPLFRDLLFSSLAILLGWLIAGIDFAALWGDDSAKPTIVFWLASSGILGFLQPRRAWRWALLVGPWLPLMYVLLHAWGWPAPMPSNTYLAILPLFPVSLVVCLVGAYGGVVLNKAMGPP